ncbi:response regulator [Ectothiorhodospira haloalkaliphila]|nr:response regulator [Ectothiorhodospira haloalkaliphila]
MDDFEALQSRFAKILPGKLETLRARYEKVSASGWRLDEVMALRCQLQNLSAGAGTFGMPALAGAARQLEMLTKPFLVADTPPDTAIRQVVRAQLDSIEELAHSEPMASVPCRRRARAGQHPKHVPLIHVIDAQSSHAQYLASTLRGRGYRVQVFTTMEDFHAACTEGDVPDAVLLDMTFLEGDDFGIPSPLDLDAGGGQPPPVLVLSARYDMDARLAAYRDGACRYLQKPVAPDTLVQAVDTSVGAMPKEPYRVLLVDDDPLLVEAHAAMLRAAGMVVRTVSKPRRTLEVLDAFQPEVVVLELYMSDVTGLELNTILRERDAPRARPILFLSNEVFIDLPPGARSPEGANILMKPVDPEQLVAAVTLRASSEKALEQRQIFTQGVLDSVSAHIAVLDRTGVIVAVNEAWRRFAMENAPESDLGSQDNHLGINYLDVCRPAEDGAGDSNAGARRDAKDVAAGIEAVMSGRAPSFNLEYPCHSPSEERWFVMTVTPLPHSGGVVINHLNITERKQAEQAAEIAKDRLNRGQIYGKIGTWEWNIATGDLFWSEYVASLFGYEGDDLKASYGNFVRAIYPDDREAVKQAIRAAVEHDDQYEVEHRVVWPDGRVRWLLERGAVQRDQAGNPLSMAGIVQDVDDRKRAELDLVEREQQLLQAQTLASLGFWTLDLVNGEVFWSDEVYRIFGREPGHFTPTLEGFHKAVHPEDLALVKKHERKAMEGHDQNLVHRIVRPDGDVRHVNQLKTLQTNAAGKPIRLIGTVQDVTERMKFEAALVAAREEAERANQAKSEFLSNMSHELRTPMNAILGFGQILEYDASLAEGQRDDVLQILKAGRHLMTLIDEVLDLAKIDSGRIELSLETVEIDCVVEECLSLVSSLAEERSIQLDHQGGQGLLVQADRTRLKQALLNLLSNAIKYNRMEGCVTVYVQVTEYDRVRVRVTDTGHGIPSERLSELFEPFNRLGAETTGIDGTGIGLTLTRRIIELMGGTVDVETEVGVGSTFWIELTRAALLDSGREPEISMPTAVGRDADVETPLNVLYIEDNPSNIKLMERLLSRVARVQLMTAHTPELGLELARSRRPELILLDINLPGMDGYGVLEALCADAGLKDTPVIAITARAMVRDIERGRTAGFFEYLTKPLDAEQFLGVVRRCLARE